MEGFIKRNELVLQEEIIPTYCTNNNKWVEIMQQSIKSTSYQFSMERMLKEYFELLYMA